MYSVPKAVVSGSSCQSSPGTICACMLLPQDNVPDRSCHLSAVSASCSVLNQTAVCFVLLCMLFHSVQRDASRWLVSIACFVILPMHRVVSADHDEHSSGRCPYSNIRMQLHEIVMLWSSWHLSSCSKQSSCSKSKDGLAYSRSMLQHVVLLCMSYCNIPTMLQLSSTRH